MEQSIKQRVVSMYEAFNARDAEAGLRTLHPDVEWDDGEGHMLQSLATVRRHWQQQWAVGNAKVEIRQLLDAPDDDVSARIRLITQEGDGEAERELGSEFHFSDGLIRTMRIHAP
jgi:ketosteroid isomerase-like protein